MLTFEVSGTPLPKNEGSENTVPKSSTINLGTTPKAVRNNSIDSNYFFDRINSLGIGPEHAFAHGLAAGHEGSILQFVRNFKGDIRHFIPEEKKKAFLRIQNRKTGTEIHDSQFYSPLTVRRLHPDVLAADPTKHKYMNEKGQKVFPLPSNLAIKNFIDKVEGGDIFFIEGYFKALAMSLSGVEAVAFTGISVYRLCTELVDYISTRRPGNIFVMYDADAFDVTKGKLLSSRRQEDFMNSIDKFSQELFALFRKIDLECTVSLVMGRPDMDGKGIDDLMAKYGSEVVANDLLNFPVSPRYQSSTFFSGFKLSRTTRRARLRKLFLGDNYRDWAEKHRNNEGKDLSLGFKYCKARYKIKSTGSLLDNTHTYDLETDPFFVDVSSEEITVPDFLDRQRLRLDQIIKENNRVAILAPTGSGKTTFFCEYARRKNTPIVIAVPTVNLAKQVADKYKGFALHGNYKIQNVQVANEAQIIACTYDTLHHVPDLWRRLLVIDEAHNLVNQYGETYRTQKLFRAEALRRCLAIVQQHKEAGGKTVLISGTMPELLCHALDCHLVKVHRTRNPKVRVFEIEADRNNNAALSKCLLTRMAEIDWSQEKLNVVFWNNSQEIENLKDTLVEMRILKTEEVAIISRRHYNSGDTDNLNSIIKKQKVRSDVKLMLCTCLISEGININNENVSRIYTVNLRCSDTFRQFVARFRKLDLVNVFSILPPERDLRTEFFFPAQFELEENSERAELQATHLLRREIYWKKEYDEDELAFIQDIERSISYDYDNQIMNLVYKEAGEWKVDILNVLARIRGRKIATSNNCYLYTQLSKVGFEVIRIQDVDVDPEIECSVSDRIEVEKELKKAFGEELESLIIDDSELLINALYLYYKDRGDRHGQARLRKFVPDLLNEDSTPAAAWLQLNRRRFDKKSRGLVIRVTRLMFLGVDDVAPFMEMSQADWNQHFKSAVFYFERKAMESRSYRKQLISEHKEEIRIKTAVATLVATREGQILNPEDLLSIIDPLLAVSKRREDGTRKSLNLLALSSAQLVRLILETTQSEVCGSGRNRTILIGPPWDEKCIPLIARFSASMNANPLKILGFLG